MILYTYRPRLNRSRSTGTPHHRNMLVSQRRYASAHAQVESDVGIPQFYAHPIGLHGIGIMILLFMD